MPFASRRPVSFSVRLAFVVGVSLAASQPTVPADAVEMVPDGFTFENVVLPPFGGSLIGFTFLPDGRIVIIERQSASVRLSAVGSTSSSTILTVPNVVAAGGEEGLLGVVADPDWPARPYLYFHYTHTDSAIYITMYEATGDLSNPFSTNINLANPYHLLTDIPNAQDQHNGGTLRFGPDGMLYVSLGDDKNNCNGAQVPSVLSGKILRLDVAAMPGAGTGPPPKADITPAGNPFPGPDDNARLVWSWGLRNPFRFSIDSATGDLFIGDVGRDDFEELDLSDWSAGAGENYGWPEFEALLPTGIVCDTSYAYTDPIWAYAHGLGPHSIITGPLYRVDAGAPDAYPAEYDGSCFVLEFYEGWIRRLVSGPSGWEIAAPVPGQPSPENWAEGLLNNSDFQQGPDGSLYLCRMFGEPRGIHRIRSTLATGVAIRPPASAARLTVIPNPVRPGAGATIRWELGRAADMSVRLIDVSGRTVRRLGSLGAANTGSLSWDGRGDDGYALPAGIYFVRAEGPKGNALDARIVVR